MRRFLAAAAGSLLIALAVAGPAAAASPFTTFAASSHCSPVGVNDFLGFKSWDACLGHSAAGAPRITGLNDIWLIALMLMEDFIKAAAYVAVGFVIWGGVKYVKSQGDPTQVDQARQIIDHALFGLVITMIAIAIVNLIARAF